MKKKVFVIFLSVVMCVTTFLSLKSGKKMNDLLLANVEALAYNEGSVPTDCVGSGSVECPGMHVKVKYIITGWSLDDI